MMLLLHTHSIKNTLFFLCYSIGSIKSFKILALMCMCLGMYLVHLHEANVNLKSCHVIHFSAFDVTDVSVKNEAKFCIFDQSKLYFFLVCFLKAESSMLPMSFCDFFLQKGPQGIPRSASGRPLGKPATSRGHVKHFKKKGKKGGKADMQYDLIVNIDLVKSFLLCSSIQ